MNCVAAEQRDEKDNRKDERRRNLRAVRQALSVGARSRHRRFAARLLPNIEHRRLGILLLPFFAARRTPRGTPLPLRARSRPPPPQPPRTAPSPHHATMRHTVAHQHVILSACVRLFVREARRTGRVRARHQAGREREGRDGGSAYRRVARHELVFGVLNKISNRHCAFVLVVRRASIICNADCWREAAQRTGDSTKRAELARRGTQSTFVGWKASC